MESEILELLNQLDEKLRKRIEAIRSPLYSSDRDKLAQVRLKVQEAINDILLLG